MSSRDLSTVEFTKKIGRNFSNAWVAANVEELAAKLGSLSTSDYRWRGSCPFYEQPDIKAVCDNVFIPLKQAFKGLEQRRYLEIAGLNDADEGQSVWTCSFGHFAGAFVGEWIGIKPTNQLVTIRYAEFHQIEGEKVKQTTLMIDLCDVLQQIGLDPFTNQRGARHIFPPPLKGLSSSGDEAVEQGAETMAVLNRMIDDLDALNKSGEDTCPPEYLARTWREDMAWYGPAGIGSVKTIPLYQATHQYPFRQGLKNKKYHGHVARFADGEFAAFFGWPNLTNSPREGYLGLPESDVLGEMRVVDVYRREGDRLAENWVIIDFPHYFKSFGVDLIADAIARQTAA